LFKASWTTAFRLAAIHWFVSDLVSDCPKKVEVTDYPFSHVLALQSLEFSVAIQLCRPQDLLYYVAPQVPCSETNLFRSYCSSLALQRATLIYPKDERKRADRPAAHGQP
jgi:hypothetical protein